MAWATSRSRGQAQELLTRAPFVAGSAHTEKIRRRGLTFLLDWLEQPGATWQERWLASGSDAAGAAWRNGPAGWLNEEGLSADWRLDALASALLAVISADVVRPALSWLVGKATGPGSLVRHLARAESRQSPMGPTPRLRPAVCILMNLSAPCCDHPARPDFDHDHGISRTLGALACRFVLMRSRFAH